jgi:hypothetical protein
MKYVAKRGSIFCLITIAILYLNGCWPFTNIKNIGEPIQSQSEPITTNYLDADTTYVYPNDFGNNMIPRLLNMMPKSSEGGYFLSPGFYEMNCKSFCMHAGKYGPSSGDGYLYAPLKGNKREEVKSILKNAEKNPQIPQEDIQELIWAVVTYTNFSDLNPALKTESLILLSSSELLELSREALGNLSESILQKAISTLPPNIQRTNILQNKMRKLFTSGVNLSYSEFEKLAVVPGIAPSQQTEIKRGRWSRHPDGYFVRYFPDGYSRTKVQVFVPDNIGHQVIFDATDDVAVPANTWEQRLAQSNEPADKYTPCPGSTSPGGTSNECNCIKYSITHIQQPDQVSCWKAAFMMAFNRAPIYDNSMLLADGGLNPYITNIERFALSNDLKIHEASTWTAEAIQEFLRFGPIEIFGLYEDPITGNISAHALVIGGMWQDCNTGEAFIEGYNPEFPPNSGGIFTDSYAAFMTAYPYSTVYILSK